MKKLIFVITLFFFLGSCQSDSSKTTSGKHPINEPLPENTAHDGHDHSDHDHAGHDHGDHSHDGHHHGGDDLNKFSGAYIGIWEYHHSSNLKAQSYIGHWIEIKRDQTFESGVKQTVNNRGTWNLSEANGDTYLELDFQDNSKRGDEQWRSRANHDVMTWTGNAPKMNTGEMLKLNKREKRPD